MFLLWFSSDATILIFLYAASTAACRPAGMPYRGFAKSVSVRIAFL